MVVLNEKQSRKGNCLNWMKEAKEWESNISLFLKRMYARLPKLSPLFCWLCNIFYIHVLVFPSKHFLSISKLFYHFGNNHEMVLSQVDITMLPCSDRDPSRILSMPSLLRAFLCIIEAAEFIRCHSISSWSDIGLQRRRARTALWIVLAAHSTVSSAIRVFHAR